MKRSPLIRRTALKRGKPQLLESGAAEWRESLGPCVVCPHEHRLCAGHVQGHHAVARQTLRRLGLAAYVFDRRNRVSVCEFRHEQHTTGYRPIPRGLLPASVFEFAEEVGLGWYIDRHYPVKAAA